MADVCVSHRILDASDKFKVEDQKDAVSISLCPRFLDVDRGLCSRLAFMCENPAYEKLKLGWEETCIESILTIETNHPEKFKKISKFVRDEVNVFFGTIASYAIIASDNFSSTLKSLDRNVLAIDTESAGVFEVAKSFGTLAITIRGISDFADKNKTDLEK